MKNIILWISFPLCILRSRAGEWDEDSMVGTGMEREKRARLKKNRIRRKRKKIQDWMKIIFFLIPEAFPSFLRKATSLFKEQIINPKHIKILYAHLSTQLLHLQRYLCIPMVFALQSTLTIGNWPLSGQW